METMDKMNREDFEEALEKELIKEYRFEHEQKYKCTLDDKEDWKVISMLESDAHELMQEEDYVDGCWEDYVETGDIRTCDDSPRGISAWDLRVGSPRGNGKECRNCGRKLEYDFERADGWCARCTAANWDSTDSFAASHAAILKMYGKDEARGFSEAFD